MKSLNEFIIESNKQFIYRVKIAGELDTAIYDKFAAALDKYQVDSCGNPKKTPIQKDPVGFPGLENQEINIFDIVLNYPASIDQIRDLGRLAGIDLNKLVVVDKAFNDSMNQDAENMEDGVRLETPEYPETSTTQKEASDAYASSYKEAAANFASDKKPTFDIAGGKTAPPTP